MKDRTADGEIAMAEGFLQPLVMAREEEKVREEDLGQIGKRPG